MEINAWKRLLIEHTYFTKISEGLDRHRAIATTSAVLLLSYAEIRDVILEVEKTR